MADYELCDHARVPDLVAQFVELSNVGFAEYEGGVQFDEDWSAWYLQRPGTDPRLCQAALSGEQMVSNVLVAVQPLQIGGDLLTCGIIDSVTTHPDHRRRGLARALMERAHEAMQQVTGGRCGGGRSGCEADAVDAAVLYTDPAGHPYQFYQRLGYETRAQASLVTGPRPQVDQEPLEPAPPEDAGQPLFDLLNESFSEHEGYSPMDSRLWRWHKCERVAANPVAVVVEETGGVPVATATFAEAELLLAGERPPVSIAYDVVAKELSADRLARLLAAAPREQVAMILDGDSAEHRLAVEVGLESRVGEVSMILPFSERARAALTRERVGRASSPTPWYPMIESIIGV